MMKNILLFILMFVFTATNAGNKDIDNKIPEKVKDYMRSNAYGFEENKGQFTDFENPSAHILFKAEEPGINVLITDHGITYLFIKPEKEEKKTGKEQEQEDVFAPPEKEKTFRYWRLDMNLKGADIRKENIEVKDDVEQGVLNYFLPHCPEGVMNVLTYKTITIKNIYPGIDWVLHSDRKTGLKYDFIVHPGANPADIQMEYNGATEVTAIADGKSILIKTPLGNVEEGNVLTFEGDKSVHSIYKIDGKLVSFAIDDYNTQEILTIDPPLQLRWCTYYGGAEPGCGPDDLYLDNMGNLYIAGYKFVISSYTGFPTYDPGGGAYYQDSGIWASFPNYLDAFILKFDINGIRQWATYYGGSGTEGIKDITSDLAGNVYMTGATWSTDFPVDSMPGAFYEDTIIKRYANDCDAFILKFDINGVRKWATYYGGTQNDGGMGINVDGAGNLYVTGAAESLDLPTFNMPGAYNQPAMVDSSIDAFILKFNNAGVLQWATYYGDSLFDGGNSMAFDAAGNLYVVGVTSSTTFLVDSMPGAFFQNTLGGGRDLFILKFNNAGVRQWATYYGGSDDEDYAGSGNIYIDVSGNIYVSGLTGSTDFPTLSKTGAYFDGILGGITDAVIIRFKPSGVCEWATYYGGSDYEYAQGIFCDIAGNVYVTGKTYSSDMPTVNPGAGFYYKSIINGSGDLMILEFDSSGASVWTTYFGGTGDDWAEESVVDQYGCLFVTGEFTSSSGVDTLDLGGGAYYQPTNTAGGDIGFMIKFCPVCITYPTVTASADTSVCPGDTAYLSAGGAKTYSWSPATGLSSTTGANVTATPPTSITYTVIGADSMGCTATEQVVVNIYTPPTANAGTDVTICGGGSTTLTASGGNSYVWNTGNTTAAITVSPATNTTYTVYVTDTNGCTASDEVVVSVGALLTAPDADNRLICWYDNSVTFTVNNPNPSYTYEWYDSLTGGSLLGTGTSYTVNNPQPPATYYVQCRDSLGCVSLRTAVTVTLGIQPIAAFTVSDSLPFEGQHIHFLDQSTYADNWEWHFGDGESSTDKNPEHAYKTKGLYSVTLIVCSSTYPYCCDTITKTNYIHVTKKSIVLVPSTFTPNGDGDNEILYVKGEGIESLKFKVFNQWGILLFESTKQTDGWDGTFEGSPQPEGNYVYTLEANTSDGQDIFLQGVVAIVR